MQRKYELVKQMCGVLLLVSTAAVAGQVELGCPRDEVFPGETVVVRGRNEHEIVIPADAKPGQRLWFQREGAWIDFTVVPLVAMEVALQGTTLEVGLTSNATRAEQFTVSARGRTKTVRLVPRVPMPVHFALGQPTDEFAEVLAVEARLHNTARRIERGLKAIREITPVATWPKLVRQGMQLRGHAEQTDFGSTRATVAPRRVSCGNVERDTLFMHPPYVGGVGYVFAQSETIQLPREPAAAFRAWVGKGDGSDPGDGIWYRVAVIDASGKEAIVSRQTVKRHRWAPIEADLSRWAGQRMELKLIVDVGPADNSSGDWGCWAGMRIESLKPMLHYVLEENPDTCRHVPGPHTLGGLTLDQLRHAKAGWLHYDGKGLAGTGQYGTEGMLNGIDLGHLTPAAGDERGGAFAHNASVPLSAKAIRALRQRNQFVLRNPHHDFFSVRRFWIELEFADGRRCSSDISTATYTQPPDWPYAEGIRVPFGQDIEVDIWFPTK